ncbi:MAG: hypothetical protein ABFD57_02985 [Smithella sp.]|nr:hypothetical protein [Syntrophaceae bacterium]
MESQSSLPIQKLTVVNPEVPRRLEKNQDSSEASGASFKTSLSESIIDVYERSDNKIAVPDERKGVDRRVCSNRRHSSSPSFPLPSGTTVINIAPYSSEQQTNRISPAKNTMPASFSPSQEKGSMIDIWA